MLFFKSENGLYFVTNSSNDPNWDGKDYSLTKICKNGKIKKTKSGTCFWPIKSLVNNYIKTCEANEWNEKHATIEVKNIENKNGIIQYFQEQFNYMEEQLQCVIRDFPDDAKTIFKYKVIRFHYELIIEQLSK